MAPCFKVAVIQFEPEPVAVGANFAKAASYIRAAAAQGCHLAVLPEFHLTSWVPEHAEFLSATAESQGYLEKYQDLARTLDISIVPGTICEVHAAPLSGSPAAPTPTPTPISDSLPGPDSPADPELRNMTYFLAAGTGAICGAYQKKNLWHPERPHLTSSGHTPHTAFDTPLRHADGRAVRAGLLICWDLAFPEAFRALVADAAELIVVPSWWFMVDGGAYGAALNPDGERLFLESATVLRAFENTAGIVFCNAGGLSCVTMPVLGVLGTRVEVGEERMEVVEVDMAVLEAAEGHYKIRKDLKGAGWHYG